LLRVAHFTGEEIMWECAVQEQYECGGLSPWYGSPKKRRFSALNPSDLNNVSYIASQGTVGKQWFESVTFYSKLILSFESDIFPALQGNKKGMQVV
jgi:hypothetical protein